MSFFTSLPDNQPDNRGHSAEAAFETQTGFSSTQILMCASFCASCTIKVLYRVPIISLCFSVCAFLLEVFVCTVPDGSTERCISPPLSGRIQMLIAISAVRACAAAHFAVQWWQSNQTSASVVVDQCTRCPPSVPPVNGRWFISCAHSVCAIDHHLGFLFYLLSPLRQNCQLTSSECWGT